MTEEWAKMYETLPQGQWFIRCGKHKIISLVENLNAAIEGMNSHVKRFEGCRGEVTFSDSKENFEEWIHKFGHFNVTNEQFNT